MSIITHKDGFKLELVALEEHESISSHFEDEKDADEMAKLVDAGELMWFCALVMASKEGILLGDAYLGCCLYASLEDFVKDSGYYDSMCDEAIAEAKQSLIKLGV